MRLLLASLGILGFSVNLLAAGTLASVVFVKGNEIAVSDDGKNAEQITHDGLRKDLPVWSEDGSKIAFLRQINKKAALDNLVIIDRQGHVLKSILVHPAGEEDEDSGMRGVETVQWLSNSRIALRGSINPSTSENLIYDVQSGKLIDENNVVEVSGDAALQMLFGKSKARPKGLLGDFFDDGTSVEYSPDGNHAAYITGAAHFASDTERRPTLTVDNQPVSPAGKESQVKFITVPQWSSDSRVVAIVAEEAATKTTSLIVYRLGGKPEAFQMGASAGTPSLSWADSRFLVNLGQSTLQWRNDDNSLGPAENVVVEPASPDALTKAKFSELITKTGGRGADIWCQSCLPRRVSVNDN
jgi:hypothetical protein